VNATIVINTTTIPNLAPTTPTQHGSAQSYTDTIARITTATKALQQAVADARRARPTRRGQTLADLHHRVRVIAADLNHALAEWPATSPPSNTPGTAADPPAAVPRR
jgi:hypothetical protein